MVNLKEYYCLTNQLFKFADTGYPYVTSSNLDLYTEENKMLKTEEDPLQVILFSIFKDFC